MELLRTRSNAWGQEVLDGANLELVVWFAAAGVILIVVHAIAVAWGRRKARSSQ